MFRKIFSSLFKLLCCLFPCFNEVHEEKEENLKVVIDKDLLRKEEAKKLAAKPRETRFTRDTKLNNRQQIRFDQSNSGQRVPNIYYYVRTVKRKKVASGTTRTEKEEKTIYCFLNLFKLNDFRLVSNQDHKVHSGRVTKANKKRETKLDKSNEIILEKLKPNENGDFEQLVFEETDDEGSDNEIKFANSKLYPLHNKKRNVSKKEESDVSMLDASVVKMDIDESIISFNQTGQTSESSDDENDFYDEFILSFLATSLSDLDLNKHDRTFREEVKASLNRTFLRHSRSLESKPRLIVKFKLSNGKIQNRKVYSLKQERTIHSSKENLIESKTSLFEAKSSLTQNSNRSISSRSILSEIKPAFDVNPSVSGLLSNTFKYSDSSSDESDHQTKKNLYKSPFLVDEISNSKKSNVSLDLSKCSSERKASKRSLQEDSDDSDYVFNETNSRKQIKHATRKLNVRHNEINTSSPINISQAKIGLNKSVIQKIPLTETKSKVKETVLKLEKRLSIQNDSQVPISENQGSLTSIKNDNSKTRSGRIYSGNSNLFTKSKREAEDSESEDEISTKKRRK